MFGYRCGIQANTKFFPFMIMIGHTPHFRTDNYLHSLIVVVHENVDVETTTTQFLQKMKLIASIHANVLFNVEQAQKKHRKTYATRKGKQTFESLVARKTMVKMKKPRKKKDLIASWEGPYQFIGHADGRGDFDFEESNKICIIKNADGHQWEGSCKDFQIYHIL